MIKKNQLVMMLALLSATPHLTLWAVESNQGSKKVSATRLKLDYNEGDSMINNRKIKKIVDLINKAGKIPQNSEKLEAYDKGIGSIGSTLLFCPVFQSQINDSDFKNATKDCKPEDVKIFTDFMQTLTDNVNTFRAKVLNDMQKEVNEFGSIEPQDRVCHNDHDLKSHREIIELFRNSAKIDPKVMRADDTLEDEPFIVVLKKLLEIRKDAINSTSQSRKYKSVKLATEKLMLYNKIFNEIMTNLIK